VLTTVDVVRQALNLPADAPALPTQPIQVQFPDRTRPGQFSERRSAHIAVWEPWRGQPSISSEPPSSTPSTPDDFGVALLQLEGNLTLGAAPLTLGTARDAIGHPFTTYAYLLSAQAGLLADGRIAEEREIDGQQVLVLSSEKITAGFSGAPVWDEEKGQAAGMIVGRWPLPDTPHEPDTCVALPAERLRSLLERPIPSAPWLPMEKRLADDALERYATTDRPVQRVADDRLGFGDYARALKNFIASQETTTPLTIGIEGAWGSGKSSLMSMLQDLLEPRPTFWQRSERRLRLTAQWLTWFFWFACTLPLWLVGKLLLLVGPTLLRARPGWLQEIEAGLAYDPAVHGDFRRLDDDPGLGRGVRHWAWLALHHLPMEPPTHPTVWFNAWKFDKAEQIWAALPLAVMDQIKQRYSLPGRLLFWLRLTFRRASVTVALLVILQRLLVPLVLVILLSLYTIYSEAREQDGTTASTESARASQTEGASPQAAVTVGASGEGLAARLGLPPAAVPLLLWLGTALTALIEVAKIVKDPFQLPTKRIFDRPDYKEKVGFIGRLETDFAHIVSLATNPWPHFGWKPQKLVIFVDDLDRCTSAKAVDLVEAINVFLDSERCVFVLGMDPTAVAASIEARYKDLVERTRLEAGDTRPLGRIFLDKIIQVPLRVPPSTDSGIAALIDAITQRRPGPVERAQRTPVPAIATAPSNGHGQSPPERDRPPTLPVIPQTTAQPDRASYAREEIRTAVKLGARLLRENPREIKRFVNLFRLYVYIADERHVLDQYIRGNEQVGLTPDMLAIWVVWSIRWPDIVRHLADSEPSDLRSYLRRIAAGLGEDGRWNGDGNGEIPEAVQEALSAIRARKRQVPGHWSALSWDRWLEEPDFLQSVRKLYPVWEARQDQGDMLPAMLYMTRVTFAARADSGVPAN
jgi:hypothetical protein